VDLFKTDHYGLMTADGGPRNPFQNVWRYERRRQPVGFDKMIEPCGRVAPLPTFGRMTTSYAYGQAWQPDEREATRLACE